MWEALDSRHTNQPWGKFLPLVYLDWLKLSQIMIPFWMNTSLIDTRVSLPKYWTTIEPGNFITRPMFVGPLFEEELEFWGLDANQVRISHKRWWLLLNIPSYLSFCSLVSSNNFAPSVSWFVSRSVPWGDGITDGLWHDFLVNLLLCLFESMYQLHRFFFSFTPWSL